MGRPVESAGNERSLARDERPDAGMQLLARGIGTGNRWSHLLGSDPGQGLQRLTELHRACRVRLSPLPRPAYEQPKLLDRLRHLLTGGGIPGTPVIALSAGQPFEPGCGTGDLRLASHAVPWPDAGIPRPLEAPYPSPDARAGRDTLQLRGQKNPRRRVGWS
jgi:hypothetical protein